MPGGRAPRKNVNWVKPQMVIEVEFRGWTDGNACARPRSRACARTSRRSEVVREVPKDMLRRPVEAKAGKRAPRSTSAADAKLAAAKAPARESIGAQVADVTLTHPDRVYWDDVGVTKEDLAEYYVAVWDWIAPHVVHRPLAWCAVRKAPRANASSRSTSRPASTDSKLRHVVHGQGATMSIAVEMSTTSSRWRSGRA